MGKRFRLNRFITKWIKSDLPQDCSSSVLLLGVTRIPTSPVPPRKTPEKSVQESSNFRPKRLATAASPKRPRKSTGAQNQRIPKEITRKSDERVENGDSVTPTAPKKLLDEAEKLKKKMDRSVDSIGDCSLDLDASVASSPPDWKSSTGTLLSSNNQLLAGATTAEIPHLPSYLSLACTVNGYSTITNYDPIRLTRSRDTSPNRSAFDNQTQTEQILNLNNIQAKQLLLSPPNLVPLPPKTMSNSQTITKTKGSSKIEEFEYRNEVKSSKFIMNNNSFKEENNMIKVEKKSFIQQRVERLYGPGALAQGFFITTKRRQLSESETTTTATSNNKFHLEFDDKENHSKSMSDELLLDDGNYVENSNVTLPVLRHLRPEFRAQLPIVSKRNEKELLANNTSVKRNDVKELIVPMKQLRVELSNGHILNNGCNNGEKNVILDEIDRGVSIVENGSVVNPIINEESCDKDGHYFLKILDGEAERLLKLADECEKQIEDFQSDLNEDVIGKIRSASGKARLLVSQKMQQFKGLCTNNITQNEGEVFPTTNADLQGFWDMVMLQVNQVDALFKELEEIKKNGWKEVEVVKSKNPGAKSSKKPVKNVASKNTEEIRKQREARELERKKMIEERRKAMKTKQNNQNIEIFVPESS